MTLEELKAWMERSAHDTSGRDCGVWDLEVACLDAAIDERDAMKARIAKLEGTVELEATVERCRTQGLTQKTSPKAERKGASDENQPI